MMSKTDADAIADVADRLFAAIEQSDIAMVEQLWNDDVVVWKVELTATATRARAAGHRLVHQRDHRSPLRDPRPAVLRRRFVQQHILHANGRNGGSISMRVCIVIKVGANGLITRIDEYFDPAEMAPLLD